MRLGGGGLPIIIEYYYKITDIHLKEKKHIQVVGVWIVGVYYLCICRCVSVYYQNIYMIASSFSTFFESK